MAKMIGLDLGASQWRVGYADIPNGYRAVPHRFSGVRFPPFLHRELAAMPEPGQSDTQLSSNSFKCFLGKDRLRAVIGENTTGEWLARISSVW